MTSPDLGPDDPVATRLDALRSALAQPSADPAASGAVSHGVATGGEAALPTPDVDGELADRLHARRSAAHVAAAYSAAHGHPWQDDERGRRRWSLAGTTALAAAGVLLAVVVVVAAVAWPGGQVTDLGVAVSSGEGADADAATGGSEEGSNRSEEPPVSDPPPPPGQGSGPEPAAGAAASGAGDVVVHVVGQVAEPGLVTLPAGSRVADAVEAAGGATKDAELAAVNLARDVVDGEQVLVPAPGQEVPTVAAPGAGPGNGSADASGGTAPVSLNTADATTLMELPGVGPVLAESIIAWRDENGPFTAVEELDEVSGIGPVMLDELRDLVVV